jgi:O-antigen/teichoic acid export membrane protein
MTVELAEQAAPKSARVATGVAEAPRGLRALHARFPGVSRGMIALADQAFFNGTSFVTAAIIGRATSPDELGVYYLTTSILFFALGLQEQVILAPYVIYSKRRSGRELAEYLGSSWVHHLLLTALTALMLFVAIGALAVVGIPGLGGGLWALLFAWPLLLLRHGIRRFALANLRYVSALAVDASVSILQLGGILILAYYGQLTILTIYAVMAGACAAASLGWYVLDTPEARMDRNRLASDWTSNWGFAKWALRSYLAGSTIPYVMPWLVNVAVGTAATGVLGACATLVGVTNVFLCAVQNILTPQAAQVFVNQGASGLRRLLARATWFLTLTLAPLCLAAFLFGDELAVAVYGDQFQGCGGILLALSLAAMATAWGMVAGNGLWAVDRPKANFVADVCCLAVTLTAAAALVVPYGALGAALATLIGAFAGVIARTLILLRALREVEQSTSAAHTIPDLAL